MNFPNNQLIMPKGRRSRKRSDGDLLKELTIEWITKRKKKKFTVPILASASNLKEKKKKRKQEKIVKQEKKCENPFGAFGHFQKGLKLGIILVKISF